LVNVWDVVTARVVEDLGFPAVATTSAGIAASLGFADGERIPFDEMLGVVSRIARAVDIPVTADMESGYGLEPEELGKRLVDAGAVGLNLEDGTDSGGGEPLLDVKAQSARIGALKEKGRASGVDLVVNARVDVYLLSVGDPKDRFDETVRRAAAYRNSGADCIFVPGVRQEEVIGELARAIEAPLNVLAVPGTPPIPRLAELGVARVSLGSGPARASLTTFRSLAEETRTQGTYGPVASEETISHAAVNEMLE
jgi:2-methylisocitrate lyase-like PEP mutase family enzyme